MKDEKEVIEYLEKVAEERTIIPLDDYIKDLLTLYKESKDKIEKLLEGE